ncbi:MAG: hypothetical protein K9G33_16170 [Sneathiella sp.]|nr:hypothetical protein [Sneathiella sp.]
MYDGKYAVNYTSICGLIPAFINMGNPGIVASLPAIPCRQGTPALQALIARRTEGKEKAAFGGAFFCCAQNAAFQTPRFSAKLLPWKLVSLLNP